jgi:23S rRNA pseudouridine2605 synthase
MSERLQKIIAQAGLASRREAETWIEQGRVTVNGKVATLGDKADALEDTIKVDRRTLPKPERHRYIMLNKPRGVLSTVKRQAQMEDRPTVVEMVDVDERLYPVGRLDLNSEGLVLMTNDGDLTNYITHPRYGHEKTYKVALDGLVPENKLDLWRRGVTLPDGFQTSPCSVKILEATRRETWIRIVMSEGHKRQIRETADVLGLRIKRLIRTHIGPLELGDLPPGQWRDLTPEEVKALQPDATASDRKLSKKTSKRKHRSKRKSPNRRKR